MDMPFVQFKKVFKKNAPKIKVLNNHVVMITRNGRIVMHSRHHKRTIDAVRLANAISKYSGLEFCKCGS